jgi:hypothetical protein
MLNALQSNKTKCEYWEDREEWEPSANRWQWVSEVQVYVQQWVY